MRAHSGDVGANTRIPPKLIEAVVTLKRILASACFEYGRPNQDLHGAAATNSWSCTRPPLPEYIPPSFDAWSKRTYAGSLRILRRSRSSCLSICPLLSLPHTPPVRPTNPPSAADMAPAGATAPAVVVVPRGSSSCCSRGDAAVRSCSARGGATSDDGRSQPGLALPFPPAGCACGGAAAAAPAPGHAPPGRRPPGRVVGAAASAPAANPGLWGHAMQQPVASCSAYRSPSAPPAAGAAAEAARARGSPRRRCRGLSPC